MRLLFCIKALNGPCCGGAERVLVDIARGLVKQGHHVTVLSYDKPNGHSFYKLHPSIERIELGIGSTTQPATWLGTIHRMLVLRKTVIKHSPDVVIGFMHSMFIPLGIALVGTNIPVVASEHIVPMHYKFKPIQAALLRTVPLFVEVITCVSEQVKQSYPSLLRKKMVAIANPVTVNAYGERANVVGYAGKPKRLLAIGRLVSQKDHMTLINAFFTIAQRFPDWELKIIGEGPLRHELESLIAKYGLNDRIILPGITSKIHEEYLAAQLFVVPSRYESLGLTTVEALVHGLPAVGFADCPGTNEVIRNDINGILVTPGNDRVKTLASTLAILMSDVGKRQTLAKHAPNIVMEFDENLIVERWEQLLQQVSESRCE
ncbi:MAG: glycosyltransferase family 4 protein [Gammaproteobacteria bacterium]